MNPAEVQALVTLITVLEPEAQKLIVALVNHFHKTPLTAAQVMAEAAQVIAAATPQP